MLAPSSASFLAIALYGICGFAFFLSATKKQKYSKVARWILLAAFLVHAVDISLRAVESVHPGYSVYEALGFTAWVVAGGFWLITRNHSLDLIGVFVGPALMVVLVLARLWPDVPNETDFGLLGRIHISLASVGVGVFCLATVTSLLYLVSERTLRNKQFDGVVFKQNISLAALDRWSSRFVLLGFPIFTASLLIGAVYASYKAVPWASRPEYPLAAATWLTFAVLLVLRLGYGWRGRKAAWLTVGGFSIALLVFGVYFVRGMGA